MVEKYAFPLFEINLSTDLKLAYIDVGKGSQTIVFLHGLTSCAAAWEKNIAFLHTQYRCIALDLPGHGFSSKGNDAYTQSFYVAIVKKFLETLQIKNAILIGHSMGGQIAIRLAVEEPNLISHLILVAPAGFEVFSTLEKNWLIQLIATSVISGNLYFKLLTDTKNYFHQLRANEYAQLANFHKFFYTHDKTNTAKIISRTMKGMLDEPVFDKLSKIPQPCLIFFGEEDKLIPNRLLHAKKTTKEIALVGASQIKNSQLVLLPQCGHYLQYEKAEEINPIISKFLHN